MMVPDAVVIGVPLNDRTATFAQALQVAAVPVLITTPVTDPRGDGGRPLSRSRSRRRPSLLARATAADVIARGRLAPNAAGGAMTRPRRSSSANAFAAELRRLGQSRRRRP